MGKGRLIRTAVQSGGQVVKGGEEEERTVLQGCLTGDERGSSRAEPRLPSLTPLSALPTGSARHFLWVQMVSSVDASVQK